MARVLTPGLRNVARQSGILRCHVDIVDYRGKVTLLTTREVSGDGRTRHMNVVEGEITTDDTADIQGTVTFTVLVDGATLEDVVPFGRHHPLSPVMGSRIRVNFSAGDDSPGVEMRYGQYDMTDIEIEESGAGVIMRCSGADVSRRIQRAQFTQTVKVPPKVASEDVVRTLLDPVFKDEDFNYTPTGRKTGVTHVYDIQADRLAEIKRVAHSVGFIFDFNDNGRDIGFFPDTRQNADPIWIFTDTDDETANSRMTNVVRHLSDEKAYNGVIAMGDTTQSDKVPPRGEAWDTNIFSPTYYNPAFPDASSYGPVPFFYVSSYLQTNKQCTDAARARLPSVLGMTEQISFDCLPNPGIEIRDPISVERPRIGVEGTYVVESVSMPMRASQGRMRVTCRERRVIE